MVRLVKPSKQYFDQIIELKQDFINNNEPRIQGSGSLDKYDDLNEWLTSINEIEQGLNPKLVPTTYYLILLDNEVVGTISMRHYLTKDWEEFGGHIGYSIKPRARRKGYAKEALKLLLDLYKDKYDEILIMCEDDNIASISKKIVGDVKKIRNNVGSVTDDFIDNFKYFPRFIIRFVVMILKFLDNHDWLPKSLTSGSIYHSTVLLSNLGSIHCDGIYHNLTNFGTNSVVVTIGEILEKTLVVDGKIEKRYVCQFGITLDERIADGVYFAKCINLLEYILKNPSLLEEEVNVKIDIVKDK